MVGITRIEMFLLYDFDKIIGMLYIYIIIFINMNILF